MTTEPVPPDLARRYKHLTWHKVRGFDSWYGVDATGTVQVRSCRRGPSSRDPIIAAQDDIETGSQVVGADDDYA